MGFIQFVKNLKHVVKEGPHTFVLGNSSADYDSIFGSLLYAYFMTNSLNLLHLPLIDCTQNDISLRFEVSQVMEKIGLMPSDLLYTDMFVDLYQANNTFLLYDHNTRYNIPSKSIVQIIDHHVVVNKIDCPNMIHHCGSALTLLFFLYHPSLLQQIPKCQFSDQFHNFQIISGKKQIQKQDPLVDELIYYGILLDTYNFDPNQKERWNDLDKNVYLQIKKSLIFQSLFTFQQLSSAKTDPLRNLALTFQQQKRKDLKTIMYAKGSLQFKIHYSTILLDIDKFLEKYQSELQTFSPLGEGQVYSFMFAFQDLEEKGKLKKFKLFKGTPKIVQILESALSQEGQFKKLADVGDWKLWTDPSGKVSRKKFDAYLQNFIQSSAV